MKSKNQVANAESNHQNVLGSSSIAEQIDKSGPTSDEVRLGFLRKWNRWYRVLRYRKGFGLLESVRYGLWLAHS